MDNDRRIRVLVAPCVLFASLLLGVLLDANSMQLVASIVLEKVGVPGLLALFAGGSILLFTLGFIIATATHLLLRLGFFIGARLKFSKSRYFEISFSDESLGRVWQRIGILPKSTADMRVLEFYAGVVFDHGTLQKEHSGLHRWVMRRWNAFNIAANSVLALVLSLLLGMLIGLGSNLWMLVTGGLILAFMFSAVVAWKDTMGMLAFCAELPDAAGTAVSGHERSTGSRALSE